MESKERAEDKKAWKRKQTWSMGNTCMHEHITVKLINLYSMC
jgi:hypothetical protein